MCEDTVTLPTLFTPRLHPLYSHKVRPHALLLGAAQAQGNGRDAPTDRPTIAVQVRTSHKYRLVWETNLFTDQLVHTRL